MKENILDLQACSMRDNLVFTGIPDQTPDDPEKLIKDFMTKQLKLPAETVQSITFHRVHRIRSQQNNNRPRPIIAKFEHYKHKELVQKQGRQLKGYACPPDYFVDFEYEAETTTVWSLGIVMYRTVCGCQPFTNQHDGLSFDSRVSTEEGVNEGGFLLPDDTSIAALIPKNSSQVLIIFSGEAVNRRPYYKQWICVSNISTYLSRSSEESASVP
ncbi:serine threonine- kinase pim-2-like protein [Labeo rohita]|uniref:Serine threonine-kinase pim-2-like protein n=1 Tax=Labeo rohita TaxID=84645 RepID=A0A498LN71_LABRO|nr:serine threonine- kinase pim-2-like protein [Labeo rohita]